jgi:hypothetical protein
MHKVFIVRNLFSLPHHCYVFELIDLNALPWDSFWQNRVHFISKVLVVESEIVRLVSDDFETDLSYKKNTYLSSYRLLKSFSILLISILSTALLERLWNGSKYTF